MQAKYPKMQLVDIRYGLGKPAESFSMAQDLINKFRGQLDAIVAPTVVALPKVAEAVEQARSEEHTSELQSQSNLVCRLLLEKKNQEFKSILLDGLAHEFKTPLTSIRAATT